MAGRRAGVAIGIEPVYRRTPRRDRPGLLARGRSVALVADQDAHGSGLQVTFLGRPASTFRGPARLALATGAPLVFGAAVREGGGLSCDRRAGAARGDRGGRGGPEASRAERRLTEAWVACLDREVRGHPEQYFWFHRRWKSGLRRARNEDRGGGVPHASPGTVGAPGGGGDARTTNEEKPS